ncbi:MAG: DUF2721 domain-containing protein [Anaerolineae bacterium]|nr:DUF2721 domain-containing protein [Anaerolineae bacterium]
MLLPPLTELIPVLQIAIGPVILISGVGLLLLSMTNRLSHVIDRVRTLHHELCQTEIVDEARVQGQLRILWQRADIIRQAIIFASVSLLLTACLIIALFVAALFRLDAGALIIFLFVGCLVALVVSLLLFIWDTNQQLAALRLDLEDVILSPAKSDS